MALTHGYVTGNLIYARADGVDGDRLPDVIPASDVILNFSPAAKQFVDPTGRLVVLDDIPAGVMANGDVTGDVTVTRNSNGAVTSVVVKEDATAGLWLVIGKYTVTAKGHYRDFTITVTDAHTEAAPLNLGDAVNFNPPVGMTTQTVAVPQGAADGQVLGWDGGLAWVTPSGGGGGTGAVASVNGKTGTVVLTASDVGAQPAGSYATAAQGAKADTAVQPGALAPYAKTADIPAAPTWQNIAGKPAVVAEGTSQTAARAAIGAGTSNLAIGTGPTTAKAGDYTPSVADVPNLPASKVTSGTFDAARIPALPYRADTYTPPLGDLPAGVTLTVHHDGANWPPRPTPRLDLPVTWVDDAGTFGIPSEFKPTVDALLIPSTAVDPEPPAVTPLDVYNFEDQANGQALTVTGDWSSFGTGPLLATNTVVAHGTLGGHMANASPFYYLDYHPWSESPSTEDLVTECYFRIPSNPGAAMTLMQLNNSGTNQANLRIMTDRTIQIRNTTTAVGVSTEALAVDTFHRVAWLTTATGQEARVYVGESTTPLFTLTGALTNNAHTSVRIGATAAASGTEFFIDTIRVATEWLAPAGV